MDAIDREKAVREFVKLLKSLDDPGGHYDPRLTDEVTVTFKVPQIAYRALAFHSATGDVPEDKLLTDILMWGLISHQTRTYISNNSKLKSAFSLLNRHLIATITKRYLANQPDTTHGR